MVKLAKNLIVVILLFVFTGTGVWALLTGNIEFGGRVVFEVSQKGVSIEGKIIRGDDLLDNYYFDGDIAKEPETWGFLEIILNKDNPTVRYCFKFANLTDNESAKVTILPPTNIPEDFIFIGGFIDNEGIYTNTTDLLPQEIAEFEYILTLTSFTTAQDLIISFWIRVENLLA